MVAGVSRTFCVAVPDSPPTEEQIREELLSWCPGWPEAADLLGRTVDRLEEMVRADGVLYVCGNGGSAADASHIVGELVKSFRRSRPLSPQDVRAFAEVDPQNGASTAARLERGIRAVSLPCSAAAMTAIGNDCGADLIFAQQVWAMARPADVVLGLSTSGNSESVLQAFRAARVRGAGTIGLCGSAACGMDGLCDLVVKAPSTETFRVQEHHLAFYHAFCAVLEARIFSA